jgi:hypothetical protein
VRASFVERRMPRTRETLGKTMDWKIMAKAPLRVKKMPMVLESVTECLGNAVLDMRCATYSCRSLC